MSTLSSAKLFGRVALLRRQVLVRQFVRRTITGALAVAALVVAAGLSTYALFLAIRVMFGDLGATLAISALYLAVAIILLIYTMRDTTSPELEALSEMETAALEEIAADAQGAAQVLSAAGHRIENLGSSVTLGISVLSALRKLLASRKP